MNKKILEHYLAYSQFTYPGRYEEDLQKLPGEIEQLGTLIRKQLIHSSTLADGNTGSNADMKYGDMTKVPWYRQKEDDYFQTAGAILTELYRRDPRGIVADRAVENKLVLTCRYTTLLVAAVLKAKGIPCRVRSGYAPYFPIEKGSWDHWINEYWNEKEQRWITVDVDGMFHNTGYNMLDLPKEAFDFPAVAWINCRQGKDTPNRFTNAAPATGFKVIGWALFYDFHCLMNNEIIYLHLPAYYSTRWNNLTDTDLHELDALAKLLLEPDNNFNELQGIWETEKKFRILKGSLL